MDIKTETCGVARETNDERAEWQWALEMSVRLRLHRRRSWHPSASRDINVRAYEVATTISLGERGRKRDRSWAKVLPEIIARREALDPAGRRWLLKRLRALAQAQHELAAKAEQRARRYEALVAQLDDPKSVFAAAPDGGAFNSLGLTS
jgi:hypothetical protein